MEPIQSKTAQLVPATGEILQTLGKQMERWVELYFELYLHENKVLEKVFNAAELWSVMKTLDRKLTTEEL